MPVRLRRLRRLESALLKSLNAITSNRSNNPRLAHGLPIVTVDYPCGASDVITNGLNGIVVGSSDSLGLANAIITLINDNANLRKMSVSARHKAEEYTESRVMGIWQNLFREISAKS